MNYADQAAPSNKIRPSSRIENDIEKVKLLTDIINNTTDRLVQHANSLGYFEPPKAETAASAGFAPRPVSINLADALADLDRAVNRNSGVLNLFD
ncbi:hypothetical protein AOQ73_05700 [Bradyrhizobium pachyrhizi]|uniref:hypothetical protein n=1 Tax=Bradyrhizobium pachyrhizi TaxID=280333 RepID=UPI000704C801|nr:hypothetical protein [Bradyrhizobium pachyrhizi]KRQ11901.1 hypothetical protein AOQ73_05700 [Bradyrhizobium pachyrhizi]